MKQEISAAAEVATEQSAMVGESQDANLDVQIKDEDERALDSQCLVLMLILDIHIERTEDLMM